MPFDVRGAKAAGYSDAEIMAFMQQPRPVAQPAPTMQDLSSQIDPSVAYPGWMQTGVRKLRDLMKPSTVTGGPMVSLEDFVPTPTSTAIDIATAALPPGLRALGKLGKGVRAAKLGPILRETSELEPWQITKGRFVPYRETVPRPKLPPPAESGGWSEAEMNARTLRARASEIEPPDITRHSVGSWGTDSTGELMQLREYSLDDPRLIFTESPGRNLNVRKYEDWINQGHEPPPLRAVETENGSIKIQEGHHRAAAIRETGGKKIKVWTSVTHNRPIGEGQVMPEGVTHEKAIQRALEAGRAVPSDVLAEYPKLKR